MTDVEVILVDVDAVRDRSDVEFRDAVETTRARGAILIGMSGGDNLARIRPRLKVLDLTLVPADTDVAPPVECIALDDPLGGFHQIAAAVKATPHAATAVTALLRESVARSEWDALYAESIAYSSLLEGPEFLAWRGGVPVRADAGPTSPPVLVTREGDVLRLTLNRPGRHNAMSRWVRDALCDGLDIAVQDPSIRDVRLTGDGPSFCSGGDLDEFGSNPDVTAAHFVRMDRSAGWRIHLIAERITVEVHGACVGAGIELPAFAGEVTAHDGSWFQLPELGLGLLPGAGGTVSLPRRIGQWRTAWLALSGERLDLTTALAWGLVDRRVD